MAQSNALKVVTLETIDTDKTAVSSESALEDQTEQENNLVRQSIREFCELHSEMHNLRENLIALGAPTQTVTVLVEMGFNDRINEQDALMMSCLKEAGGGHIEDEVLQKFKFQLHELTNLERDMAHARKIANQSGLSLPALNSLTNMIRQNPGDKGAKVVNSFLAYAMAMDIPLNQIEGILKTAGEKPKSVLPDIKVDSVDVARKARNALIRDVLLGVLLAASLLWALT